MKEPIVDSNKASSITDRRNLICNFRAPDFAQYQIWLEFKEAARAQGLNLCFLTLSLCQAWLKSLEKPETSFPIKLPLQVINLQQQNTFVYCVQKPRREPFELVCARKIPIRTLWSKAFQAYVLERARELNRSFSFVDFLELGHDFFRKLVLNLKNRGKIVPLKPRSNPRYYTLIERISDYPTMRENNAVKPKFTEGS